jgi:hypothetical protein
MLFDSFDFKPYVCFDFQNMSIYDIYMYYYWPYAISVDYRISGGF